MRQWWRTARSAAPHSASQLPPTVINASCRISLSIFILPHSSSSSLHSLHTQSNLRRNVLIVFGRTGSSGLKEVGWRGRSHGKAVVNQAAAFRRRCNDSELLGTKTHELVRAVLVYFFQIFHVSLRLDSLIKLEAQHFIWFILNQKQLKAARGP